MTALKRFSIFSNLFDSQRVRQPIINEQTGVAVLCCHGKIVVLTFLHQK